MPIVDWTQEEFKEPSNASSPAAADRATGNQPLESVAATSQLAVRSIPILRIPKIWTSPPPSRFLNSWLIPNRATSGSFPPLQWGTFLLRVALGMAVGGLAWHSPPSAILERGANLQRCSAMSSAPFASGRVSSWEDEVGHEQMPRLQDHGPELRLGPHERH